MLLNILWRWDQRVPFSHGVKSCPGGCRKRNGEDRRGVWTCQNFHARIDGIWELFWLPTLGWSKPIPNISRMWTWLAGCWILTLIRKKERLIIVFLRASVCIFLDVAIRCHRPIFVLVLSSCCQLLLMVFEEAGCESFRGSVLGLFADPVCSWLLLFFFFFGSAVEWFVLLTFCFVSWGGCSYHKYICMYVCIYISKNPERLLVKDLSHFYIRASLLYYIILYYIYCIYIYYHTNQLLLQMNTEYSVLYIINTLWYYRLLLYIYYYIYI